MFVALAFSNGKNITSAHCLDTQNFIKIYSFSDDLDNHMSGELMIIHKHSNYAKRTKQLEYNRAHAMLANLFKSK